MRRNVQNRSTSTRHPLVRAGWLLLLAVTCIAGKAEAQRTVMVYQEPRHRVVVDEGEIKLLDVQIVPGDTTMNHTHDAPILYTYINLGNGPVGRVVANTDYAEEEYTHNVTNGGDELFRIIALTNYSDGEMDLDGGRPEGMRGDPQVEDQWFRSYRVELAPGDSTALQLHHQPTAVVQASDGIAVVTNANGFPTRLDGMGDWAWRHPESPFRIRNTGSVPVVVMVNEARR